MVNILTKKWDYKGASVYAEVSIPFLEQTSYPQMGPKGA